MQPKLNAFDASDKPIRPPAVMWITSDGSVADVDDVIRVIDTFKPGQVALQCHTFDKSVSSNTVSLEVVDIASITLKPDTIEVPVGSRRRITATCKLTSGEEATDVALAWLENDPSVAKVSASGSVFGFTKGSTEVTASDDRVEADTVVTIEVVPGESDGHGGSAYPRVLVSEIDRDPDTGEHVVLKSDDPPVHQLPYDYERNVWWINSASPLAALYLSGDYGPASREWRIYHTERYVDVIVQIAMSQGPEAEDTLDVGEWLARWGERAADIQSEVAKGLKTFIIDGGAPVVSTPTVPRVTVHDKLLLAAAGLEDAGNATFTAEDLVVAAWRFDPEAFGLAGHLGDDGRPAYPNSNRVFVEIMGSKPIRKQGLLAKSGTKTFRLTESGRQRVQELRSAGSGMSDKPSADAKVSFGRDTARKLQKLLGTRAVDKMRTGRRDEVTFTDASSFWGISPRSSAMAFQARLGDVEGVLRAAERASAQRPIRFEHGGKAYSREEIQDLLDLHQSMLVDFADHLNVIRGRRDQR